ncbi:unnamed protein product [Triticum aestivum]|uniref:F-box domain-containing protein n=2 Tax=Triticum aestivum TaxID=4565 RepID=A0A9R1ENB5_WHEAT|nr:uncharacterized protein LOC123048564 [Triticum aestivum]KAF7013767.1 hypothetical protein CFC21_027819 [Triticum aestivum]SPT16099.1 unnamed protein product [Triticum aestivum]
MTRRRRRRGSPPAPPPPPPLENDDLLREILLRIPPQPSSLPRASAVCKRWRCAAVDPKFVARFRAHHGKPPLLGFFQRRDDIVFAPVLAAPDRVPPERFDLRIRVTDSEAHLLGCRHGRVLVFDVARAEVVVCDPITGERRRVAVPPELKTGHVNGAVLCADRGQEHVHGGCRSSPFKVVLVFMRSHDQRPLACVYSSETDTWGHLIPTEAPHPGSACCGGAQSILVGNVHCWPLRHAKDGMLQFDLDRQSLDVIETPPGMNVPRNHQIVQAEDGTLGLAILSHHYHNIQMWQRKVNCQGVATWVPWKTTEMHDILGLSPPTEVVKRGVELILGYDQDANEMLLYLDGTVYIVQLKSMQSRKL